MRLSSIITPRARHFIFLQATMGAALILRRFYRLSVPKYRFPVPPMPMRGAMAYILALTARRLCYDDQSAAIATAVDIYDAERDKYY